jgi:hypothetical protein
VQCARRNPQDALPSKCGDCGIACSGEIATCKTRDLYGKMAEFETFKDAASQKEKKFEYRAFNLSRFFRGTIFAHGIAALTISSPETQRMSPSKGRAT